MEHNYDAILNQMPFVGLFLGGILSAVAKPIISVAAKALPFLKNNAGSIINAGGNIAGGLIGAEGAEDANSANAMLARENRDWQERMSNTAHQREVEDLRAAGINPILSAKFGGSSTPPGNVATMTNPGEFTGAGISSAGQAYWTSQLTREQVLTQRSVQSVNSAQAMASRAAALKSLIDAQKIKAEIPAVQAQSERESQGGDIRNSKFFKPFKWFGEIKRQIMGR
ncbi:MAG: putative minor capsid protein [Microviridae sp. ctD0m35]|nr:MAG: putative minor capsid protein [Microviridae sp. ctudC31]QGH72990.1 MAG: putative minor capsid protein [Microviridae sp. ctD0m35]